MRNDRGVGLIELLVVMSLLTLALAMFGLAFSAMLRTSDASRDIGAVTDQARLALNELDRQIRFGYWVRPATVESCFAYDAVSGMTTGPCTAIKVLTTDAAGVRQCWVWALDEVNGRLMTYHYPAGGPSERLTLARFGLPGGRDWHVAAGPEGGTPADDVRLAAGAGPLPSDPRGLGVVASSLVKPLDPSTFLRASYYLSAYAGITVSKPGRSPVTIGFNMSVRNQWIGAQYSDACG